MPHDKWCMDSCKMNHEPRQTECYECDRDITYSGKIRQKGHAFCSSHCLHKWMLTEVEHG